MEHPDEPSPNAIEKSITWYASSAWLRTFIVGSAGVAGLILPVIPAFVGAVDVALTTHAQKVAERRLDVLCSAWEQEMEHVPDAAIDKTYMRSEEFFDLLFQAWEATKRTRHDEKIHLYAQLLVGSVQHERRKQHSPEDYLAVLAELSPRELEMARALYEQQKEGPNLDENELQWLTRLGAGRKTKSQGEHPRQVEERWADVLKSCPSVSGQDIEFVLLRLQRVGLIKELTGAYLDYAGGAYVITNTFRRMMEFLHARS